MLQVLSNDDLQKMMCVPRLQFNAVGLKLKSGVQVLSGVTGRFPHSQMHAVLGPSGSGGTQT